VRLSLRHPGPRTLVSVKLQNVAPDGSSQQVTSAAVNLAVSGAADVELRLMATGWRFQAGHRIRLAVAPSDWPNLMPLPRIAPLEITGAIELSLPGLPADARAFVVPDDTMVDIAQPGATTTGGSQWRVITDVRTGRSGIATTGNSRAAVPAEGWSVSEATTRQATALDDDPLTAELHGTCRYRLRRPGLAADVTAESRVRARATEFIVDLRLRVAADDEPFAERRWHERIPRDGV
jgi:hypothetical protein